MAISTREGMHNISSLDLEKQITNQEFDYSKRSQWLRAAVLGANDGLVSTVSLMMGIGAVKQEVRLMILTGFVGLVAGACSMAIGEYVSVYSQLDIEVSQMKREEKETDEGGDQGRTYIRRGGHSLPNPMHACVASGFSFAVGALVPLLSASFIVEYRARMAVMVAITSVALAVFGCLGAALGKAPVVKSSARVLVGGWVAMAITFGLTKLMSCRSGMSLIS